LNLLLDLLVVIEFKKMWRCICILVLTRHIHATIFKKLNARLGNQLFQYASVKGIAAKNLQDTCIFGDIGVYFDIKDAKCTIPQPSEHIDIGKYATYIPLTISHDTVIDGYLQSYKYFDDLHLTFKFKSAVLRAASIVLAPYKDKTIVGIHVRHTHHTEVTYSNFPPDNYFVSSMSYFEQNYNNVHFVVA